MMDFNIGDHNAFSKFSLGWINPVVATDSVTVELDPFETSGDCLILSTNTIENAFNEYFIVEYYTPDNLFELDSLYSYVNYPKFSRQKGIRIFHIDARLIKFNNMQYTSTSMASSDIDYSEPYIASTNNDYLNNMVLVGASNTPSYVYDAIGSGWGSTSRKSYLNNGKFSLIELVTSDNVRTFNNYAADSNENHGLFLTGDVFSTKNQSNFFINSNNMHDKGDTFNYSLEVVSLGDTATLKIVKG